MRRRRATTEPPPTGTINSAAGRRGSVRRPVGYGGRTSSSSRQGLADLALGENNRSTGGKASPSTGIVASGMSKSARPTGTTGKTLPKAKLPSTTTGGTSAVKPLTKVAGTRRTTGSLTTTKSLIKKSSSR